MVEFAALAQAQGIQVMTGDVALAQVNAGALAGSDVWVIQEDDASLGAELLQKGARALVLLCAESPLYARKFYKRLPKLSSIFPHRFIFRGAFKTTSPTGMNHVFFFPSYDSQESPRLTDWADRKFAVMVAGNKYLDSQRAVFRRFIAQLRDWMLGRNSWVTAEMKRQQLHDRRLELIEYFGKQQLLSLFGMGWNNLGILPKNWEIRLKGILTSLAPRTCENKIELVSGYQFSFCIENYTYPGYVTEKLIDCFRAGVIPVYLGAPDVADFFPRDAFMDIRNFDTYDQLKAAMCGLSESDAMAMIGKGRQFLQSEAGLRYSYQGVAQSFMQVVLQENAQ